MNQKKLFTTNQLVYLSLLTALTVILDRSFIIQVEFVKLTFKFIPISISAMLFGPLTTALMAAVADTIGVVFLSPGPLHLGFTLSALITGFIYGYFYYKKPIKYKNIILANIIMLIVITAILNSVWVYQLLGAGFTITSWYIRVIKELIILPIKIKLTYEINLLVFNRLKNRLKLNKAN